MKPLIGLVADLLEFRNCLVQVLGRLLIEGRDLDVDHVVFETGLDWIDADDVAHDLDVEGLVRALADDRQVDRGIDEAAHLLDRLLERQAHDLLVVQVRDEITGQQSSLRGGGIVDRRDHLYDAVLHRHLDAEAAEFAAGLHLHVLEILRIKISRVWVERGQHAVDGTLDQSRILGLFDIIRAHALQHVAEQIQLPVDIGIRRGGGIAASHIEHRRAGSHRGHDDERPECDFGFANHACTFILGFSWILREPTMGWDRRDGRLFETLRKVPAARLEIWHLRIFRLSRGPTGVFQVPAHSLPSPRPVRRQGRIGQPRHRCASIPRGRYGSPLRALIIKSCP